MDMLSYPYVRPFGVASRSRNGAFIPMMPLLLAASLTCPEANELIEKMRSYSVEDKVKSEMIQIVKEETQEYWDAND